MTVLGRRTLNIRVVTFGIDGDALNRSLEGHRPVVVGVDEAMSHCAEADHVDLILIAYDEVVCR